MTIQEATFCLLKQLRTIYSEGEANTITDWVMEHITGSKKAERMIYKNAEITSSEESELIQATQRLSTHEPVQYVLGESWFYGIKLFINKNVLIPRPETEELVSWIVDDSIPDLKETAELRILDIGTGSGCIPVALKNKFRGADVWTCDVSVLALEVAKKNMENLDCPLQLVHMDFLDRANWQMLGEFDIIVSNPPYVTENEKSTILSNVLNHEPHDALFVPDNNPLIFYRAIGEFAKAGLKNGGSIYVEINESLGKATTILFEDLGYTTELRKDLQGKDRMLKISRPWLPL